jgi:hypothetical protein
VVTLKRLNPKLIKNATRSGPEDDDPLERHTSPFKIASHGLGTVKHSPTLIENAGDAPAVIEMTVGQEYRLYIPEFFTIV